MFLVTPQNKNIERCAKIIYNNIEIIRSPEDIMSAIDRYFSDQNIKNIRNTVKKSNISRRHRKMWREYRII